MGLLVILGGGGEGVIWEGGRRGASFFQDSRVLYLFSFADMAVNNI